MTQAYACMRLSPLVIGLVNTVHLARGSPGQGENSASNETSLYELKIYGMTFRRTFHQLVKGAPKCHTIYFQFIKGGFIGC